MEKKKLLDIFRDKIRVKHYSLSTERTYLYWIKYYIIFHNKRDPKDMGKVEIEAFLNLFGCAKKGCSYHAKSGFFSVAFFV